MEYNTKDWTIGHYPKPPDPKPSTLIEVIEQLELFNHKSAARYLRLQLSCTCSSLTYKGEHRCDMHPNVRAKSPYEKMDFEAEWDRRIDGI